MTALGSRRSLIPALLGSAALAVICAAPASAGTELFLTWPGISGPSVVVGHVGDIELTSYSQSASKMPPSGTGTGSRTGAPAVCGQVVVTKHIDKTSPIFLGMVLSGKASASATVTFVTTPSDATFYSVKLENILVTSIQQSDSASDVITETLVLQAGKFIFTFTPRTASGAVGMPVTFGWDCVTERQL